MNSIVLMYVGAWQE